jgi:broad-specificity NMP kinase
MTCEDLLKDFVLELLRRGYSIQKVAEALAAQKIALCQADEYVAAQQQSKLAP